MQQMKDDIIKLIQGIEDQGTLKIIYQFIRGIKSGRQ